MAAQDVAGSDNMIFPASNAEAVTPSDSTELTYTSRALYVGVGGNISVEMAKTGDAVIFKNVPTGTILPVRVTRVNSTSTTATDIVSIY